MNSVVLVGRLTRDPELRYSQNQTAVARFSLAVDRPFSRNHEADFINIVVFGKQAENCDRYLAKGRQAAVQGRIQTGSYVNKDGHKIYTTDVVADRVEFLGGSGSNGSGAKKENQSRSQNSTQGDFDDGFSPLGDDMPDSFQAAEDDIPF